MTEPSADHRPGRIWTTDDLARIEDETHRYELIDGSLLVSPHPDVRHFKAANTLREILSGQAPAEFLVGQDGGIGKDVWNYLVPDVVVVLRSALHERRPNVPPAGVRLVVEVLSPSNGRNDLAKKRRAYAKAGIPLYWIVDPDAETVTALALSASDGGYDTEIAVEAGKTWTTDQPFPFTLDPADLFW